MMNRRCVIGLIALTMLLCLPFHASVYGQKAPSKGSSIWEGKTFTRYTYEEDIKDTLTAISKLAGIPFTFGEGITDRVTMEFKKMPLKDAFDFLVSQFDLEYTRDAHAIHIFIFLQRIELVLAVVTQITQTVLIFVFLLRVWNPQAVVATGIADTVVIFVYVVWIEFVRCKIASVTYVRCTGIGSGVC